MSAEIQFNVDAALAKLGELVEKHGQDAVNTATHVVQVNGIGTVASGLVCLGLAVGGVLLIRWEWKRSDASELFDMNPIPCLAGGLVALIAGMGALIQLLDPWVWVAVFDPRLALAKQILAKIAGL